MDYIDAIVIWISLMAVAYLIDHHAEQFNDKE